MAKIKINRNEMRKWAEDESGLSFREIGEKIGMGRSYISKVIADGEIKELTFNLMAEKFGLVRERFLQPEPMPKGNSFGWALERLREGDAVRRKGWNGRGIYILLQIPDENSKMSLPYIYIETLNLITDNEYAPLGRVPWVASQTDILAEDWEIC